VKAKQPFLTSSWVQFPRHKILQCVARAKTWKLSYVKVKQVEISVFFRKLASAPVERPFPVTLSTREFTVHLNSHLKSHQQSIDSSLLHKSLDSFWKASAVTGEKRCSDQRLWSGFPKPHNSPPSREHADTQFHNQATVSSYSFKLIFFSFLLLSYFKTTQIWPSFLDSSAARTSQTLYHQREQHKKKRK